jgi:HEAT repeat protein
MKAFDRLLRAHAEGDEIARRLALHQMENVRLGFDAEDCLTFLDAVVAQDRGPMSFQARRTLRRMVPQYDALRYRLRQPPSSAKAGTWTEYNIDRAEIDKLKRLGHAQTQDFTHIQTEQFVKSGLHLLSAPIERLMGRVDRLPESALAEAIGCLSNLGTPEAIEALNKLANKGPVCARLAAGALAEIKSDLAFQALAGIFVSTRDPEIAADIAIELRSFPTVEANDLAVKALDGPLPLRVVSTCALAGHA